MNVSSMDILNETLLEDDVFESIQESDVEYHDFPQASVAFFIYVLIMGLIKLALCLAVISAEIFLAVVIFRFKKLKTRLNMYILNLCFITIFFYIGTPLYFVVCHFLFRYQPPGVVLVQTQSSLLLLYFAFAFLLALDWFVSGWKPHWMVKYHNNYQFVFAGIYFAFFIEWILGSYYAETHHMVRLSIIAIIYGILIVLMVLLNILKRAVALKSDANKTAYAFYTSNVILFSFLPYLCFHLLYYGVLYVGLRWAETFLLCIEFIPSCISIGHPIWVVYMLGKQDKYFKTAYKKSFKRNVRTYADDDLDGESEDETLRNSVQVNSPSSLNVI